MGCSICENHMFYTDNVATTAQTGFLKKGGNRDQLYVWLRTTCIYPSIGYSSILFILILADGIYQSGYIIITEGLAFFVSRKIPYPVVCKNPIQTIYTAYWSLSYQWHHLLVVPSISDRIAPHSK
jgi:hypothetical protein